MLKAEYAAMALDNTPREKAPIPKVKEIATHLSIPDVQILPVKANNATAAPPLIKTRILSESCPNSINFSYRVV